MEFDVLMEAYEFLKTRKNASTAAELHRIVGEVVSLYLTGEKKLSLERHNLYKRRITDLVEVLSDISKKVENFLDYQYLIDRSRHLDNLNFYYFTVKYLK